MSSTQKTKKVVTATSKVVGYGIFGPLKAIWKYGGKWLIISNIFSFLCVGGLYNWLYPEYTVLGYFITGYEQPGFMTSPTTAGMLALFACLLGAVGYMANNTKRSLGVIGIGCISVIIGLLAYWSWTLGAFDTASVTFIATVVEASLAFILAFGLVYAKLDRIISGRVDTDSHDVS